MSRNGVKRPEAHVGDDRPPPPVNTAPPTISGTAQQGPIEHSNSWTNSATSYAFHQWLRCDS